MSLHLFYFIVQLFVIISKYKIYSIPACIIIDTNMIHHSESETLNNHSSIILRNLRKSDNQHLSTVSEYAVDPIPLSFIDIKQTTLSPLMDINPLSLKKSLTNTINDQQTFAPCSINLLNEIETQMVVPFEFRRLRIEQPDHWTKYLDDKPYENVSDLSTAVYERRSDPEGVRFCRTCRDGFWTQLTVCDTVRCDAELLRANPRLVTDWGEIKPLDGGALYAPSTIFAIYAFAFGPHCKRCELNGQWSRYALPELCSGIKFFSEQPTTTTTIKNQITPIKLKPTTILSSSKLLNKKQ